MTAASPPAVTAVISTHNRRDDLLRTLRGLKESGYDPLRIVVVDNASYDGTAAAVRGLHPDVQFLPHSDNAPLRGYNIGFDAVRTPYTLVLDDDSCPRRGTIERMVGLLEQFPEAGAVAANILRPDGTSEWGRKGNVAFSDTWFNLIGCGFLARSRVLLQADGYDTGFGLYYNDLELAIRILVLGYRVLYDQQCIVDHRKTGPLQPSADKYRLMMRNFPLIARHHFTGLRRFNLVAGHALAALGRSLHDGAFAAAIRGFMQGLTVQSYRAFVPAASSPAIEAFVGRYALSRILFGSFRRLQTDWPARPAARVSRRPFPRRRRGPKLPPPCPRAGRIRQEGVTLLKDPAFRRQAEAAGCSCLSLLPWYVSPWPDYQQHLLKTCFVSCSDRAQGRFHAERWPYRPRISILTPVYKLPVDHLRECLLSVERQIYPNWELCLVEDGGGMAEVRDELRRFTDRHPGKVRLVIRDENLGIARTSQEAFELATGEFIALLDHDDRLAPEALWEVVHRLNLQPDLDWIYSDNDKVSPTGERWYYHFKPDWSPDLFWCTNYALHLSVIRRDLAAVAGGFRKEFEGSQDYGLYLRVAERTRRIEHIPRILYSWRESQDSVARSLGEKPYVFEAGRRALAAALDRRGQPGTVEDNPLAWIGNYRVRRSLPSAPVTVAVMGDAVSAEMTADLWSQSSAGVTIGQIFVSGSGEREGQTLNRVLNFADASYLFITRAGCCPLSAQTLADLLRGITAPGVAILAPKVVDENQRVDHCGLALAPGGRLIFPLRGLPAATPAYGAYGAVTRNVSAVSPVAAVVNISFLRKSGNFDSNMDACGALVSACLDLRIQGFHIAVDGGVQVLLKGDPFAPGPAMEPGGRDHLKLTHRYPSLMIGGDPYYNRNLRMDPPDFGVWYEANSD